MSTNPCEMSTNFNSIREISPQKESWTIMAKVIRLWLVADFRRKRFHSLWNWCWWMTPLLFNGFMCRNFCFIIYQIEIFFYLLIHVLNICFWLHGDRIHASVRRTLIYKFQRDLFTLSKVLVLLLMVGIIELAATITNWFSSFQPRLSCWIRVLFLAVYMLLSLFFRLLVVTSTLII